MCKNEIQEYQLGISCLCFAEGWTIGDADANRHDLSGEAGIFGSRISNEKQNHVNRHDKQLRETDPSIQRARSRPFTLSTL